MLFFETKKTFDLGNAYHYWTVDALAQHLKSHPKDPEGNAWKNIYFEANGTVYKAKAIGKTNKRSW